MIKTWFKEYKKIKDKAVVVYPYEWDCMSEKQRNKILSKKNRYYERRKRICL